MAPSSPTPSGLLGRLCGAKRTSPGSRQTSAHDPKPTFVIVVAGHHERVRRTARARASLQVSLRLATADLRQAANCPPSRWTLAHCCRRWALQSLRNPRTSANLASVTRHGNETSRMCSLMQARRLLFPGGIPGHSFLRSATQCPTANLSCAVAFDDHNIKIAPIIRMIFTTEGPPNAGRPNSAAKNSSASRLCEIELKQMSSTAAASISYRTANTTYQN